MCSRVLLLLLLAMSRNHGTMSFVFGPLAAFTPPQVTSSPAPPVSTLRWTLGTDATTTATTTTTTATTMMPFIRRRPTANRRRPIHGNIVFPTDDNFASFTESKNPLLNPQNSKDHNVLTHDGGSVGTEQRFSPGVTPRPDRPEHVGQGSDGAIVFDGPLSLEKHGDKRRVRPPGSPWMFESTTVSSDRRRVRPTGRPLVFGSPAGASDVAMQGFLPDSASGLPPDSQSPPPPCFCPTTSEANPICAEVQGARVTMVNISEFKCARICLGETDVVLLFHGRCQKTINKLNPFIHD